ncbi:MAG: hypothetical protein PF961_21700 [Planctomycetota bacterium]|jgi:hypothetical protein|nr:hypothetical protein [Planctomycetota bacterium]
MAGQWLSSLCLIYEGNDRFEVGIPTQYQGFSHGILCVTNGAGEGGGIAANMDADLDGFLSTPWAKEQELLPGRMANSIRGQMLAVAVPEEPVAVYPVYKTGAMKHMGFKLCPGDWDDEKLDGDDDDEWPQ